MLRGKNYFTWFRLLKCLIAVCCVLKVIFNMNGMHWWCKHSGPPEIQHYLIQLKYLFILDDDAQCSRCFNVVFFSLHVSLISLTALLFSLWLLVFITHRCFEVAMIFVEYRSIDVRTEAKARQQSQEKEEAMY